jgi:TPR repeat protein
VPGPTAEDAAKSAVQKQETTKRTVDFLKKRAETGSASAQFDLGKRYLVGDGVETNRVEARKWFEAAAKQEHEGAIARLKQMDAEREKEKEKDALRKLLRPAADSEPAKPEAATGKEK